MENGRDDDQPHFAMNVGDGPLSYIKNSSYQRGALDVAMQILEEEIARKLELSSKKSRFNIADFGCSSGSNSFHAMQTIIEAVKRKHDFSNLKNPHFCVFFNDVATNDFNTLFTSLPPRRSYDVAAVPGDFHRRLLPPSSLHFAYSSWALHWLTAPPLAVADGASPAWNGGEILYRKERKDVCDAYLEKFGEDVEAFLNSRAVEMVDGGLAAVIVPGVPAVLDPEKEYTLVSLVEPLTSCLVDMVIKGRLSQENIDSFNIPEYLPTLEQLKAILERNPNFIVEKLEIINNTGKYTFPNIKSRALAFRTVHESMFVDHFGGEIIDELFEEYEKKLAASPIFNKVDNDKTIIILAILKHIKD